MKLSTNLIFQFLASLIQFGTLAMGLLPAKAQMYLALIVGLAQAAVAWRAHYSNPDGTPAAVGYLKK